MSRSGRNSQVLVVLVLAALAVGAAAGTAVAANGTDATGTENNGHTGPGFHVHRGPNGEADVNVCSYATPPGAAHCNARVRTDAFAQQLGNALRTNGVTPAVTNPGSGAYGPADLQAAYAAPSATKGAGLIVAIVDAYNDPNAESDLGVYRSTFGLPACTTANGCFKKVNQNGVTYPYPSSNIGWAQEISLDVDMVSAMCPLCHILLVEANSSSFSDLGAAVNRAASMGAIAISNSYGTSGEFSSETAYDSSYYNHPGVAVTASSGDSGYGVEYPAASRNVVAVGGTSLKKPNGVFTETAWSGAGSGCSAYESKPSWQHDTGCSHRTVTDVSAIADPQTGVWAYDTYGSYWSSGWLIFGGTSVASPIIASVFALAGSPWANQPASYLYGNAASLHDVVSGSNGNCGGSYLCTAKVGYDGPTGLGTPNTAAAFLGAPSAPDFSVSASPTSLSPNVNASSSSTITLAAVNGYSGNVTLSAAVTVGSPSGLTLTQPASPSGVPSTATLGVTANTPGSYTVTVTATDGTITHTAPVTVNVAAPDFSVSASPTSLTPNVNASVSSTITLGALGGYGGNVTLSASVTAGSPSGLTLTQPTSPTGVPSTATLGVTANTPGSYTVTVTATDGTITHTAPVTATVAAPDFSVSASPTSLGLSPGSSNSSTLTLGALGGYSGNVTLSAAVTAGSPSGLTLTQPASPTGVPSTATLGVTANTAGSYTVTVTATDGTITHTATVAVSVSPPGDFSIAVSPTYKVGFRGSSVTYTVTITRTGGFTGPVTLAVAGQSVLDTVVFSPNPIGTGSTTSVLTLTTKSGDSGGSSTLTFTGTSGSVSHSVSATLYLF
jgi:subtilase family serine protease